MNRRVCASCFAFLLVAWASASCGLLHAADAAGVKVYPLSKTREIARVRYARAVEVVLPDGTTTNILVARSDRLAGFVQIGPTAKGADKLTRQQILNLVAAAELEQAAQLKEQEDAKLHALWDAQFTLRDAANQHLPGSAASTQPALVAAQNLLAANLGSASSQMPTPVSCAGFT